MRLIDLLAVRAQQLALRLQEDGRHRRERGDVPGWVLITLMTAGIVTALWVVTKEQLISMFQSAMSSVKG